ncbi:hypothetical protein KQX54_007709 [Cotesia glomerata]|uniref:Uncharacterized protein n=1 Tax=Cotesia glomerata TaxID=32391 RepID=A0AAV7J872_COTGL|nr:hypothetical protein KQX54_007709 [Cotesia glomerata]
MPKKIRSVSPRLFSCIASRIPLIRRRQDDRENEDPERDTYVCLSLAYLSSNGSWNLSTSHRNFEDVPQKRTRDRLNGAGAFTNKTSIDKRRVISDIMTSHLSQNKKKSLVGSTG